MSGMQLETRRKFSKEDQERARLTLRERRHWAVVLVFEAATEKGWHSPGWEPFSQEILRKTGKRIPAGTLKYWHGGYSEPKVSELEAMAATIDLDLDLMNPSPTKT